MAKARNLPEEELKKLVLLESINFPFTGIYVNVLSLNIALDEKGSIIKGNYGNGSS
jgi:K+-transporting ATPase ATPase C chain